jgi:predicted Rossmann fold nucleotide-binding protein DprA/Smf involved in DNA uptake
MELIQQMTEDDVDVGGRPQSEPDDVFVDAVASLGMAETSEVREEVRRQTDWDVSHAQTGRRLNDIAASGDLVKKNKGRGKANEWMLPDTFEKLVPNERFLSAMGDEMMTISEISDETGFNEGAVLRRLQKLENEGRVISKRPEGAGTAVWVVDN